MLFVLRVLDCPDSVMMKMVHHELYMKLLVFCYFKFHLSNNIQLLSIEFLMNLTNRCVCWGHPQKNKIVPAVTV